MSPDLLEAMSMSLRALLQVCLPTCLPVCLSAVRPSAVCLSVRPSVCLSVCLSEAVLSVYIPFPQLDAFDHSDVSRITVY